MTSTTSSEILSKPVATAKEQAASLVETSAEGVRSAAADAWPEIYRLVPDDILLSLTGWAEGLQQRHLNRRTATEPKTGIRHAAIRHGTNGGGKAPVLNKTIRPIRSRSCCTVPSPIAPPQSCATSVAPRKSNRSATVTTSSMRRASVYSYRCGLSDSPQPI